MIQQRKLKNRGWQRLEIDVLKYPHQAQLVSGFEANIVTEQRVRELGCMNRVC
jgi:hypothetical protein